MSAPSIPNLLSMRGSRGGGRGRGGSRGGHTSRGSAADDATIQGTDTDAAISRWSAVQLGYLDDPYARYFVSAVDGPPPRRLPIINRGTYTRTTALDTLIEAFLSDKDNVSPERPKQIVSLGAGTDTRSLRIFSGQQDRRHLVYHEVDFDVVTKKKLRTVQANQHLSRILGAASTSKDETSWGSQPPRGGEYRCHGLDLRRLSDATKQQKEGSESQEEGKAASEGEALLPGLRTDLPTLILSECCLCYLSPPEASGVLSYFTSRIRDLATIIYEPIRPDDPFGKVMTSNLLSRQIRMPTLSAYPEPSDQEGRLRAAGFDKVKHMTMGDIWNKWFTSEGRGWVDSLEGLDEVEEWELLAAHYIVIWGSRGEGFQDWDDLV